MLWIAPSEKDTASDILEKRLWKAAHRFPAVSGLKSHEYSAPVLGLIFLRFAEVRFAGFQNHRRTRDRLLPRLLSGQAQLKTEEALHERTKKLAYRAEAWN